jgi:hypothetical protein
MEFRMFRWNGEHQNEEQGYIDCDRCTLNKQQIEEAIWEYLMCLRRPILIQKLRI